MPSINQTFGSTSFPLIGSDVAVTKSFADPLRDTLLAMIVAATNAEFGTEDGSQWFIVREGTSLATKLPVNDSFPSLPTEPILKSRVNDFPIIFLDRLGSGAFEGLEEGESDGMEGDSDACEWAVTWCLGPLRVGEAHKFNAAIKMIFPRLVRLTFEDRCHPAYNDGAIPFGPGGIPLGSITVREYDAAEIPVGEDKQLYYGVSVQFRTVEHSEDNSTGIPFLGANHSIRVGGREGVVSGILDLNTDFPRKG